MKTMCSAAKKKKVKESCSSSTLVSLLVTLQNSLSEQTQGLAAREHRGTTVSIAPE